MFDVSILLAWTNANNWIVSARLSNTASQDILSYMWYLYSEILARSNCLEGWGIYRDCRECNILIINPCLFYFLNSTAIKIRGLHHSHLRPITLRLTYQTITSAQILKTLNFAALTVYFTVSVQYSRTLCT